MVRSPSGWKDESSVKQSLERFVQRKDGILYIGRAIIFIGYIYVRVITTLSALKSPRELADTPIYLRISSQPILGPEFLSVDRPFVFPLLLQIVHQDFASAAIIQLVVALLAWGLLALAISASLRPPWLRLLSFFIILAVGTVRHLAGWDSVMMTESLSLSMLGLFIASGIWLLHGWKYHKVVALCAVAFLFAFARDTNAYLLIMFAGLMLIAVLFRWMNPRALVLAGVFGMFFFVSDLNANTSQRWFFPLVNVIGKRILPYTESIQNLAACGMPITPQLLSLADTFANGNDRAFFNDPALAGFRVWVAEDGKTCYIRWLVTEPKSVGQAFSEFDQLIYFENVNWYFSKRYIDPLPAHVERVLYPVYHVTWLWAGLTITAFIAVAKRFWRDNALWAIFIMLCLTIFPHLFITWHGDAMAPNRHAVSVGMQLALAMWLLVFLVLEKVASYLSRAKPG